MKRVRYDEDADEELIEEIARYELRREGLGIEFLTAVREAVRLITQNPGAWQASEHAPDVRRFVMERFPFTIVYRACRGDPHHRGGPHEPRTRLLAQAAVEGTKKESSQPRSGI
jgi:hypothetical protein